MTGPHARRLAAPVALALAATAALAAAPVSPPTYEQKQKAAAVSFQADAVEDDRVEVRLSRTLQVTLTVEGGADLRVEAPEKITASPGWEVRRQSPPQVTDLPDNRRRWQETFPVTPVVPATAGQPVDAELQLAPLRYRDAPGDGPFEEVTWRPIPVRVTSEVAKADLSELRDITPPEEPPAPTHPWARWLPWLGVAVALAGLVAGGWGLRRRLAGPAPPPAPHEWAARELDRIEAEHPPEGGEVERYHTLLSDVVRAYLERRFNLPASQQTTAEFLETMRRSPQLTPAQQGLLRDFLERCDMAKFARAASTPEECRAVAAMARAFVRETTPSPK